MKAGLIIYSRDYLHFYPINTNTVITMNKPCGKENPLCITQMGEMTFDQKIGGGGYCETQEQSS